MNKIAVTDYPIEHLLARRWSPRSFANRPIAGELIHSLFEAARWAPSANNLQPWAFLYAVRGTKEFDHLLATLKPTNAIWAKEAAMLVLASAISDRPDGSPNTHARYDLGQAVAHLTVQATAQDLYVHQMAGFDAGLARATFGVPDDYDPVVMIAVGFLGDGTALPEETRIKETAARSRKPVGDCVFNTIWKGPGSDI
ncbi:nitroreductase family protein [Thalassospira sp.]|uniref:nitroreductase family protein n=1 Tax=Thalassospira sp. TaxID=1912094 RepID=UPI002735418B|nr:nitroreductase family protein [Thalassospira sp.]MDP2696910.1 nitroreductase family protein [Thalassospira sp.]